MANPDTAADYRARANRLLTPSDGMAVPSDKQLRQATVLADLAKAAAIGELTAAIREATTAGIDPPLPPAIHHSH